METQSRDRPVNMVHNSFKIHKYSMEYLPWPEKDKIEKSRIKRNGKEVKLTDLGFENPVPNE